MFVILMGLFIVGSSDLLTKKCAIPPNAIEIETLSNRTVNATVEACDEKTERMHSLIGDIMLVGAQVSDVFTADGLCSFFYWLRIFESILGPTIASSLLGSKKSVRSPNSK